MRLDFVPNHNPTFGGGENWNHKIPQNRCVKSRRFLDILFAFRRGGLVRAGADGTRHRSGTGNGYASKRSRADRVQAVGSARRADRELHPSPPPTAKQCSIKATRCSGKYYHYLPKYERHVSDDAPSWAHFLLYAGHDIGSGVQISTGPVRRNPKVEDKFATVRSWMKEVQGECRRTRTGSGYKAYLRARLQYKSKPKP